MKYLKLLIASLCLPLLTGCCLFRQADAEIVPEINHVTSISQGASSLVLGIGEEYDLDYIVYPTEATNKAVRFYESANAFDVVNGKVIGKTLGDGELRVVTVDGGYTAKYFITVMENPTQKTFPVEAVAAYYAEGNVAPVVPVYTCEATNARFVTDVTSKKWFDVYTFNTDSVELINYKSALIRAGWHYIDNEDDFFTDRLQYKSTKALLDIYDYIETEPYLVLSFFIDTHVEINTIKIMTDVAITAWGEIPEGALTRPDINGVIKNTVGHEIISEIENPQDTSDGLQDVLYAFIAKTGFPKYIFRIRGPIFTPSNLDGHNTSELYFVNSNWDYVLHLTSYCVDNIAKINFEAGPNTAFPEAFVNYPPEY